MTFATALKNLVLQYMYISLQKLPTIEFKMTVAYRERKEEHAL